VAEGRKRFKGVLAGVEDDQVAIDLEGEEATALVPFSWIVEAKLSLTDKLLKRAPMCAPPAWRTKPQRPNCKDKDPWP